MEEKTKALQMRFPAWLYDLILERAEKSRRSFNAEALFCLEKFFGYFHTDRPMTLIEAAEYLTITPKDLRDLAKNNKITHYRPTQKTIYFRIEDLDAYLDHCRVQ